MNPALPSMHLEASSLLPHSPSRLYFEATFEHRKVSCDSKNMRINATNFCNMALSFSLTHTHIIHGQLLRAHIPVLCSISVACIYLMQGLSRPEAQHDVSREWS